VRTGNQQNDAGEQRGQPSYISPTHPVDKTGRRVCSPACHVCL